MKLSDISRLQELSGELKFLNETVWLLRSDQTWTTLEIALHRRNNPQAIHFPSNLTDVCKNILYAGLTQHRDQIITKLQLLGVEDAKAESG